MNRPIRRIAIGFGLLFFALLANLTYIQGFQAEELNQKQGNKRVQLDEYAHERGAIWAGGERVASSVKTNDLLVYQRKYNKPFQYGLITGFYSTIYGRSLLEQGENELLSGSDPRLFVRRVVDLLTNRQPRGGSVVLTVQPKVQQVAYEGLEGKKGAVVALDPKTGAVLAMASRPSYDPNPLASHKEATQEKAWKKYALDNKNKPMNNRAVQERYPPGSTFKIVTSAAALSSGQYQPDTKVPAPTVLQLPQTSAKLNNWQRGLCGSSDQITLTQALESSCNTAFGSIGLKLGDQALHDQAQKFGFGTKFLEEIRGAESVFPQDLDQPQTALAAIGQSDVQATPLQMAMVTAAIANGGQVMEPYIIKQRNGPDTQPLDITKSKVFGEAVTPEVADQLNQMMVSVVENGTGDPAQIPNVKVGGKTGTAQNCAKCTPYAWFVSFAPADNPKVAVAVFIENADVQRSEISGGRLAAPIAKAVMEAVINP